MIPMFNITPLTKTETDPECVVFVKTDKRGNDLETERVTGEFYRVKPTTAAEVFAIQWMEHQREKYAPARGEGILISAAAIEKW